MIGSWIAGRRRFDTVFRFLLAGGSAAAVNWIVRFPLSAIMPFWLAVWISALIGMILGFVLYRSFVFPASARSIWREIRDFLIVNLATTLVVTAAAAAFVLVLAREVDRPVAEAIAHAIAIAAGAILNFFGHRIFTFRPSARGPEPHAEARHGREPSLGKLLTQPRRVPPGY